jgi:hypothetical protein
MAFDTIYNKNGTIRGYAQTDNYERIGVHNLLHVQDQKAAGTQGGDFTSGAWRTRVLNTILVNNIAEASLGSNQITLPAGSYYAEGLGAAYIVTAHSCRLFNITDSVLIADGLSCFSNSADGYSVTYSKVSSYFNLLDTKIIELQHRCNTTRASTGFGVGGITDKSCEIYADLKIWKVA